MNNKLLNQYLNNEEKYKPKFISKIFTKILLSFITILISLIYVNYSDKNKEVFQKYFLEDNFSFYKFKNFFKIKDNVNNENNEKMVTNDNVLLSEKVYLDGISFDVNGPVESLTSGIVVFVGNKDGYNNTVIIQGSDGYDIWYGNLENIDINIYDYLDENTILGDTNTLYLKIVKDGENISYRDYINV